MGQFCGNAVLFGEWKGRTAMSKVGELLAATKLSEVLKKKEECSQCKCRKWIVNILIVLGVIAAVAAVAYAVYYFLAPDSEDDFEDEFDDEFDEEFFREEVLGEDSVL